MAVTASAASPVAKNKEVKEHPKRNSGPGVRMIRGRVYDPSNGKTCHQCRQKTLDFSVSCTVVKKGKPCPINYCYKCLLNRYGEKADEMSALGDWRCPKCREMCNCSFCRKRKGEKPTGNMARTAKENGFLCVSEMLQVRGPENICKEVGTSQENAASSDKDSVVTSLKEPEVENVFAGNSEANMISPKNPDSDNKFKQKKRKKPKMLNENGDNGFYKETSSPKKAKTSEETAENGTETLGDAVSVPLASEEINDGERNIGTRKNAVVSYHGVSSSVDIALPQGTLLTTIAGIELSPEDAGNALQFLEFCAAFGEAIDTRKAQAKSVLRELHRGRTGRCGQYSSVGRIHVQLLSLIQPLEQESLSSSPNGKYSWLQVLQKCISESECSPKDIASNYFAKGSDAYEKLGFSRKLRLLNFLCDEALQTIRLREYIDKRNSELVEEKKEAKEKFHAAKEKEKEMRQQLKDELAKTNEKDSASLANLKNESISQLKGEVARAHAEVLEAADVVPKKRQGSHALRTEPILVNNNGNTLWKLNGYSREPNILLQDIGTVDASGATEKWFVYDSEQKEEIEKYIILKRMKKRRSKKTAVSMPAAMVSGEIAS